MRTMLIIAVGVGLSTMSGGCAKMSHLCGRHATTVCAPVAQQPYCAPACQPAYAQGCAPAGVPVTSGTSTYLSTPTIQVSPEAGSATFSPGPEVYTPTPANR